MDKKRIESFKILLYEAMTRKRAHGKGVLLDDLRSRFPKGITSDELNEAINQAQEKEYVEFVPANDDNESFRPGPRFSLWKSELIPKIPQVSLNKIEIGEMHNSQIQQNVKGSQQTVSFTSQQSTEFLSLIHELKEAISILQLNRQDQNDIDLELATLENQQKSSRKSRNIIKGALETISTIVHGAAGSGVWAILEKISSII